MGLALTGEEPIAVIFSIVPRFPLAEEAVAVPLVYWPERWTLGLRKTYDRQEHERNFPDGSHASRSRCPSFSAVRLFYGCLFIKGLLGQVRFWCCLLTNFKNQIVPKYNVQLLSCNQLDFLVSDLEYLLRRLYTNNCIISRQKVPTPFLYNRPSHFVFILYFTGNLGLLPNAKPNWS